MSEDSKKELNMPEEADGGEFEGSTVLSAPEDLGQAGKKKNHWLHRFIIIGAVVFAAALAFGAAKLIEHLMPEESTDPNANSSITAPSGAGESVTDIKLEDIKSVTITAGEKRVVLLQVAAMEQKPDTQDKWVVEGISPLITSGSIVSYRAEDAGSMIANRLMPAGEDYGLDNPTKLITIEKLDGSKVEVTVGKVSPDTTGYYCRVSTAPDKVYLMDASQIDLINADPLHYADKTVMTPLKSGEVSDTYFQGDSGTLNRFDSITVTGSKIDGKIELAMTKDTTKFNIYSLSSPIKAFANDTAVLSLLSPLTDGVTVSAAVSYDYEADKEKYGLDNPAYIAEYKVGEFTERLCLSVSDADGKCYLAVGTDPKAIYSIHSGALPFEGLTVTGLYASYPFFENVTTVEKITISGPKGNYVFDLTHIDAEENDDKLKVVLNGTQIATKSFRNLYQKFVLLSAISFTTEANTDTAEVTIKVEFLGDGAEDTLLSLVRISDMRYHLSVNGAPYGIVSNTGLDTIFSACETLASGGTVE